MNYHPDQFRIKKSLNTGLVLACEKNNIEEVKRLIADGVDVNKACITKTALMESCISNNYELVKILLNHGADINKIFVPANKSTFSYACQFSSKEIINLLLDNNIDISNICKQGNTALMYYIEKNPNIERETLERLISVSSETVQAKNSHGKTAHDLYVDKNHDVLDAKYLDILKGTTSLSNCKSAAYSV